MSAVRSIHAGIIENDGPDQAQLAFSRLSLLSTAAFPPRPQAIRQLPRFDVTIMEHFLDELRPFKQVNRIPPAPPLFPFVSANSSRCPDPQ